GWMASSTRTGSPTRSLGVASAITKSHRGVMALYPIVVTEGFTKITLGILTLQIPGAHPVTSFFLRREVRCFSYTPVASYAGQSKVQKTVPILRSLNALD